MRHTRPAVPVLAVFAALVALLALTGCSNGSAAGTSDASASVGHHHTKHTQAAAGASTGTSTGVKPSASATPSGPPACRTRDLRVAVTEGEGAAGSTYYKVSLTNTSGAECRTGGFGGVSLVGDGNGSQLGAPADRSQADQAKKIVLAPDAKAEATLQVASADNYSASKCRPAPAEGFRVYPPNETHSAFVETGTTGCRNKAVHLLTLSPYALVG